ncbi:hypothetical protein B9Z19DRAFT_1062282 [Tuber borchii]|uniref:Uncharacterized protein n=1 Tax=Tuber borchii TaxID=42251 RepID=A0A2T7A2A2_TUBBO|nr:hypothetical protein B9Z19DRAFT_1062282 [Tuber borchii]
MSAPRWFVRRSGALHLCGVVLCEYKCCGLLCAEFIMSAMMLRYGKTGFYFMIAAVHITTSTNIAPHSTFSAAKHTSPSLSNAETSAPSHLGSASSVINRSIKNHMNSWQSVRPRTNSDLTKKNFPIPTYHRLLAP